MQEHRIRIKAEVWTSKILHVREHRPFEKRRCPRIAFWTSKGPNPRGSRRFEKHICIRMVSLGRPTVCLIPDEKSKESSLTCVQSSHGAQRRKTPLKPLRPNWAGVYWRAGHLYASEKVDTASTMFGTTGSSMQPLSATKRSRLVK